MYKNNFQTVTFKNLYKKYKKLFDKIIYLVKR